MSLCLGSRGMRQCIPLAVVIIWAILLSSCGSSSQSQTATATTAPTNTPTAVPATPTAVPIADIAQDGDFETPVVSQGFFQEFNAGQTFGNWKVSSGSVDLIGKGYWVPEHGNQSLDLDGSNAGTIYQDVPTIPGRTYTISFYLAGNPVCGPAVKKVQIMWGTLVLDTLSFDTTGHSTNNMGWKQYTYSVPGGSASPIRLSFASLTNSLCGAALDNVTVIG